MYKFLSLLLLVLSFYSLSNEHAYNIQNIHGKTISTLSDVAIYHDEMDVFYTLHKISHRESLIQAYKLGEALPDLIDEYLISKDNDSEIGIPYKLNIIGNTLIAEGSNNYHKFQLIENELKYVEELNFPSNNRCCKYQALDNEKAITYDSASGNVRVWDENIESGELNFLFEYGYMDSSPIRVSRFIYDPIDNKLWLVSQEYRTITFTQYTVNYDEESLATSLEVEYTLPDDYDYVNDTSLLAVKYNNTTNKFFISSRKKQFIFSLKEENTLSLDYEEDVNIGYISTTQLSNFSIETNGAFTNLIEIDWNSSLLVKTKQSIDKNYLQIYFLTPTMLYGYTPMQANTDFFSVENQQLTPLYTESNNSSQNLPDRISSRESQVDFEELSGHLMIIGETGPYDNSTSSLYLWRYNQESNDVTYNNSASIGFLPETEQSNYAEIIGQRENSYYIAKHYQYNGISTSLARFQQNGDNLLLVQDVPLPLNDEGNAVQQLFFAKDSIIAFHYSSDTFFATVCKLTDVNAIGDCTQISLLDNYDFSSSSQHYRFYFLDVIEQFVFAPMSHLTIDEGEFSKALLLDFDNEKQNFSVVQEFPLAKQDNGNFLGIKAAYSIEGGSEIFLGYEYGKTHQYKKNAEQWERTSIVNSSSYPQQLTKNHQEHYYIEQNGTSYWYDESERVFYKSNQSVNIGGNRPWFQLTGNNKGIMVDPSERVKIATFTLENSKPTIYKGTITNNTTIEAVQDVLVNINIEQHFINLSADDIEIKGLNTDTVHPKFSWDGTAITGTLDNEDMFYGIGPQPAKDFQIRVYFQGGFLAYYNILPVNVNDAPILIEELGTQYLKEGESYYANFFEIVSDPDREKVTYTYENIPTGFTASAEGSLEGKISKSGTYRMTITATDPHGAKLKFDLVMIVNKSGEANESSSSGGGGLGYLMIVLVLATFRTIKLKAL